MLYLLKMAFRNINRNRRRSILAFTSVAISIAAVTFFRGFAGGVIQSIVKNSTKNETGHIRITTTGFQEKSRFFPVTENISAPGTIIKKIKNDPQTGNKLDIITERINIGVLLNNRGLNKSAVGLAGDPEVEKELLLLQNSIIGDGRYIKNERETIVGTGIAGALNLSVGDTLKVMTRGADYALHLRKFTVVGLFQTGLNMLDDRIFQIPLDDAKKLLRTGGATQQIVIMLKDYKKSEAVAANIRNLLSNRDNLSVVSWTENGEWGAMVKMSSAIYNYVYFFIAFLGAFIITNIMMMVVLERRKEIGILKSMGITNREVMLLFLCEGMILGLIGSLVGMVVGMAINTWFAFKGLDMSSMMGGFNFPMDSVLYFDISPLSVVYVLMIGIIVSAAVSVLPSWRASRMNAVDAIKSV
ncbi:MAG: FtsX-like permease family protein [Chitinivibrionales bacterium]|nr:FtsX-like permease family protein [Chitinivibrionales bacterium]